MRLTQKKKGKEIVFTGVCAGRNDLNIQRRSLEKIEGLRSRVGPSLGAAENLVKCHVNCPLILSLDSPRKPGSRSAGQESGRRRTTALLACSASPSAGLSPCCKEETGHKSRVLPLLEGTSSG